MDYLEIVNMQQAAVKTLQKMGYTWTGGELWRPPLGPIPNYIKNLPDVKPEPKKYTYGGVGGISDTPALDETDLFQMAVVETLGQQMKTDDSLCVEMWSALANQAWQHENGETALYSFRAAGDLIAAVIQQGNYINWYCSGPYAVVSDRIKEALKIKGWFPIFNQII